MNQSRILNAKARTTRSRRRREAGTMPSSGVARRSFAWVHGPIALLVVLAGALRLHGLGRRVLVRDEGLLFDPGLLPLGLGAFSRTVWQSTTYNPGWAAVVWLSHRLFGISTFWMRVPSVLASSAATIGVYVMARTIGLGRRAALCAGAIMALSVFQIEYGQQILPHALLPLGGALCVGMVTRIVSPDVRAHPERRTAYVLGFLALFGALLFFHNSVLLLAPPLFLYWGWNVARPEGGEDLPPSRPLRADWQPWLLCLLATGLMSAGWVVAKLGESDRGYLHTYFPGTFRHATNRDVTTELVKRLDTWYFRQGPRTGGTPGALVDFGYFSATRLLDTVFTQFRVVPEQYIFLPVHPWLLPLPMLALFLLGVIQAVRGRMGERVRRWSLCLGATFGLILLLSCLRLFPLGGVRHLICLSPLLVLPAAASFELPGRWLSRSVLACGLIWTIGTAACLPKYYAITADRMDAARFRALSERYGVRDFVAADTFCSVGALRIHLAAGPARVAMWDDPAFIALTQQHRPFFFCTLVDPPFDWTGQKAEVQVLNHFTALAPALANLKHYKATPIENLRRPVPWLAWTVLLMEPEPGPYPPQVVEVRTCGGGGGPSTPTSVAVWFDKPINPATLNPNTVRLLPRSRAQSPGWDAAWPVTLQYFPETRMLMLAPQRPLPGNSYLLALERTIFDREGQPLEAVDGAFRQVVEVRP